MNHKRHRPKNQRAGCLLCKFWKVNGFSKHNKDFETSSSHKSRIFAEEEIKNYSKEEN